MDEILKRIAENGVQIKIIVYNEPTFALAIDSAHTKLSLEKMHENIKVVRHPSYILPTFLWSHHEKLVVVDQEIGFMGGLDLCYGRMDTPEHLLFDKSEIEEKNNNNEDDVDWVQMTEKEEFFPGIDYSNCRKKDFAKVNKYQKFIILFFLLKIY